MALPGASAPDTVEGRWRAVTTELAPVSLPTAHEGGGTDRAAAAPGRRWVQRVTHRPGARAAAVAVRFAEAGWPILQPAAWEPVGRRRREAGRYRCCPSCGVVAVHPLLPEGVGCQARAVVGRSWGSTEPGAVREWYTGRQHRAVIVATGRSCDAVVLPWDALWRGGGLPHAHRMPSLIQRGSSPSEHRLVLFVAPGSGRMLDSDQLRIYGAGQWITVPAGFRNRTQVWVRHPAVSQWQLPPAVEAVTALAPEVLSSTSSWWTDSAPKGDQVPGWLWEEEESPPASSAG